MKPRTRLTFVTLAMALCGCKSTHQASVKDIDDPYHQKGRIQWNDSKLSTMLTIEKVQADRTEAGLLRVRMVVKNDRDKDIVVDIRTLYLDEGGFEKEGTNWEPIVCTARTQKQYDSVSLSSKVHDYQIIIREGRAFSWQP